MFTLAGQDKPGFRKIGVIDDKRFYFEFDGDEFEIESESPILDPYRKWNVWVLRLPDFKPTRPVTKEDPFIYYPGPSFEFFLEKTEKVK